MSLFFRGLAQDSVCKNKSKHSLQGRPFLLVHPPVFRKNPLIAIASAALGITILAVLQQRTANSEQRILSLL
jgi:hypothetical protein